MTTATAPARVNLKPKPNYETTAWKWMRYSGVLLVPLVWIHVAIQDVIVGVHNIDINYVALRWANIGWQVYDILLLAFTFAHGMNGLRQVSFDFFQSDKARRNLSWIIFVAWLVISFIGAMAIIGGARTHLLEP
ncbi:MAG: succinate dehydrogenase [Chloroflexi bacterium]|nr:succinate dehydrogenase [Chloroflexota bacterium]